MGPGGEQVGVVSIEQALRLARESDLDLVVAGTESAVLMVESEAEVLSEDVMLGAVVYGHDQMQIAIKAIAEFAAEAAKPAWNWVAPAKNETLSSKIAALATAPVGEAYRITEKAKRYERIGEIKAALIEKLTAELGEDDKLDLLEVGEIFHNLESKVVRGRITKGEPRIDGRDPEMIRGLSVMTGVLPRTHGSALFTRGETQALVTATLGTARDAQTVDDLLSAKTDTFMLHYNFPPYSVGETGMIGSPKRREIGHGRLAKRGVQAVMPEFNDFPYTVRIVSEITESNGSSSMASVCGSSLALMDAGVPIKASVAGIAMGLVKEGDDFVVLSDILGDEDHLGDMDFKVAGTSEGITALQMDIKIDGITKEIMQIALKQAKAARLHILNVMDQAISGHREEMSEYAPRIYTMKINPEKIREVIGKGGAVIRQITEESGTTIELEDDGSIKIAATTAKAAQIAIDKINAITAEIEVGAIYEGEVVRIVDFGAFVNVLPGKDGLVHISQISEERVNNVSEHLTVGQKVKVKVLEVDKQGRVRLSIKEANAKPATETANAEENA